MNSESEAPQAWFSPERMLVLQSDAQGAMLHDLATDSRFVARGAVRDALVSLATSSSSGRALLSALAPTHSTVYVALEADWRAVDDRQALELWGWGQLFVELTGTCNERCAHCYSSSSPEIRAKLSVQEVRDVIDDAAELGFERVQFTGGDPLLAKTLPMALEHAVARGCR